MNWQGKERRVIKEEIPENYKGMKQLYDDLKKTFPEMTNDQVIELMKVRQLRNINLDFSAGIVCSCCYREFERARNCFRFNGFDKSSRSACAFSNIVVCDMRITD